jgi:hypothetical protein
MSFRNKNTVQPVSFASDALNPKRRYMTKVQEVIASEGLETPFHVEEYCVIVTVRKSCCYVIELKDEQFTEKIKLAIKLLLSKQKDVIAKLKRI